MPDTPPFQIGLALAGGTSAGAYTAGVLDFLVEALDAWAGHQGREVNGTPVPALDVQISTMAGASAGGICGAILSASADLAFPPARADGDVALRRLNPFYHVWVNELQLSQFLGTSDLPQEKNEGSIGDNPHKKDILSVLDSSELTKIAERVIDFQLCRTLRSEPSLAEMTGVARQRREWLADPFHLHLTVTNLRGVPHGVHFQSLAGNDHVYVRHADYVTFEVPVFENEASQSLDMVSGRLPQKRALGPAPSNPKTRRDDWRYLVQAALATSSFPIALEARHIANPVRVYQARLEDLAETHGLTAEDGGLSNVRVWPEGSSEPVPTGGVHEFYAVDGGVMNNEPLQILERDFDRIARIEGTPKGGHDNHAIIMIDPFTDVRALPELPGSFNDPVSLKPEGDVDRLALLTVAGQLVSALIGQSRFHTEDLVAAMREDQPHRFLIAPLRGRLAGDKALIGSELGTFMGFFHHAFREHDFFLGRRNCQLFLKHHFKFAENHPLIQRRLAGNDAQTWRMRCERPGGFHTVVPLIGDLMQEIPHPEWPIGPELHAVLSEAETRAFEKEHRTRMEKALEDLDRRTAGTYRESYDRTVAEFEGRIDALKEAVKKAATAQDRGMGGTLKEIASRIGISVFAGPALSIIQTYVTVAFQDALLKGLWNISKRHDDAVAPE
ncbi:MAG: patatin-like phospholipase family protein [Alphaproteobacteria bacterium]